MNVNPFSLIGEKIDKKDIFVEFKGVMGDDIPSLDFNDYTTNGWYESTGTNRTGSANVPHASDNGYLLVVSKSRTVYQYWYSTYQSLGTMVRARKNGTWGSWGTVALTSDIEKIDDISFTPLNSCDLSKLYVRKEANKLVHIRGYVKLGTNVAANASLSLASIVPAVVPASSDETFSVGYCYDKFVTCLVWFHNGNLEIYKVSGALNSGDVVIISMTFKANS